MRRSVVWSIFRALLFGCVVGISITLTLIVETTRGAQFPALLAMLGIGYMYAQVDLRVLVRRKVAKYLEEERSKRCNRKLRTQAKVRKEKK